MLDASYGERMTALARPFWVCDSPVNRLVAERLWSVPNRDPMAVTVFDRVSESNDRVCADNLPTIHQHHPRWTEIAVVGADATPAVRECFAPFEPGHFAASSEGFTFIRS